MNRPSTKGDLSGSLLVSHPMMADPTFRHTILYLSHHSAEDGALGFILNRPLGQDAPAITMAKPFDQLAHLPIYEGGPVHPNEIIVASLEWNPTDGGCQFHPMEKPEDDFSLPSRDCLNLRVFLGYAGWSKNQLEKEIAFNSWLVIRPHPEFLRTDADDGTWHRIMDGLGPMYKVLADAPDDPSQN